MSHIVSRALSGLIINRINLLFDNLFVIVHRSIFYVELTNKDSSRAQDYLDEIGNILYKTDEETTKAEALQLISRRSYLLKELIKQSSLEDKNFISAVDKLFVLSSELLSIHECESLM